MPRRRQDPPDKPIEQPERGPAIPTAPVPVRVRVDEDTLITRTDLGPTSATFVAAGDNIPVGLESYPRNPA